MRVCVSVQLNQDMHTVAFFAEQFSRELGSLESCCDRSSSFSSQILFREADQTSGRSKTEIRAVAWIVTVDVQWRIQGLRCVDRPSAEETPLGFTSGLHVRFFFWTQGIWTSLCVSSCGTCRFNTQMCRVCRLVVPVDLIHKCVVCGAYLNKIVRVCWDTLACK